MKRLHGLLVVVVAMMVLPGCGAYRHHEMGGYGKSDGYWEKAGKDMTGLVEKTVQDPEKAKRVNAVMGEMIAEIRHTNEQGRQLHRKLYELNARYDAAPEEFAKILDELNGGRARSGMNILALRFKMKELLTAQEWKALTDEMKAYGGRYYGKEAEAVPKAGS